MKHDVLRSVAHNIADSLACGNGFLIGVYQTDVYAEADRSPSEGITIDFLRGVVIEGSPSDSLKGAVRLYRDALPELCEKHSLSVSDFAELTARYSTVPNGRRFIITVTDRNGRQSAAEYGGLDAQRTKMTDSLGRLRPKPVTRS